MSSYRLMHKATETPNHRRIPVSDYRIFTEKRYGHGALKRSSQESLRYTSALEDMYRT